MSPRAPVRDRTSSALSGCWRWCSPSLTLFLTVPETILRLAFGADYVSGADALVVLGLAMSLLAISTLAVQYMLALHQAVFLWLLRLVAVLEPLLPSRSHAGLRHDRARPAVRGEESGMFRADAAEVRAPDVICSAVTCRGRRSWRRAPWGERSTSRRGARTARRTGHARPHSARFPAYKVAGTRPPANILRTQQPETARKRERRIGSRSNSVCRTLCAQPKTARTAEKHLKIVVSPVRVRVSPWAGIPCAVRDFRHRLVEPLAHSRRGCKRILQTPRTLEDRVLPALPVRWSVRENYDRPPGRGARRHRRARAEQVAMRLRPAAEPWVGVEDVAAHLSCRRHRVYDLVCRRHVTGIPHRKDGARSAVQALADRRVDRERRRRMSAAPAFSSTVHASARLGPDHGDRHADQEVTVRSLGFRRAADGLPRLSRRRARRRRPARPVRSWRRG